jgi:hypothetical protein
MHDHFQFLRDTWRLIKPYWTSEERFMAWLLLGAVIVLTLAMVYMNVQFNYWNNDFYNALQEKDKASFWRLMGRFTLLATIYIVMAVYAFYLNQMLQIRWRRWLTDSYLNQWLSDRAYYRLQLSGNPADNPDQRISEDLKIFVDQSLELALGFLNAVVTLASFVGILWGLSGPAEIPYNGGNIVIPGYMVWAALFYAIVGTWLTHKIGKKLIGLSFNQQRFEADFRFGLVRFRENTEGVALYRGEQDELRQLVGDHAAPENTEHLHDRLQPGGHHFSVPRRGQPLFCRSHPAGRTDADFQRVRTRAGIAFVVHRCIQYFRDMEGNRGPAAGFPLCDRQCAGGNVQCIRRATIAGYRIRSGDRQCLSDVARRLAADRRIK